MIEPPTLFVEIAFQGMIVVPTAYPISLARIIRYLQHQINDVAQINALPGEDPEIAMRLELYAPPTPLHLLRRVRPTDLVDLATQGFVTLNRNRFDETRGLYKPAFKRVYIAPAYRATARCTGDAKSIRRILAHLTHVGANRTYGYGKVKRIEVKTIDR